ncbi:hypothetical protein [Azospirillum griseum]|uniref:Uncharacterized protein n=1 Tax=Azospirillum griseum TaxID=2496639 RepID=A0A431VK93_9PROT|nr:hypothetical protein [Azospirillum griseum]RTR21464.1 hypothetical protein EJ903_08625 [Azospirillum griseum]
MTETLLALYFAVLVGGILFKSRIARSQWLFLLRAFFPNWKFFDQVGHVPHLWARSARKGMDDGLIWSDWLLIYPRRTRRWWHLVHNPDTNLGLGQQNMVDHFWSALDDLPDGADPRGLVTYALMERLVQNHLRVQHGGFSHWQFELRMVLDGPDGLSDAYTMMQSPVTAC